jgi:hypothetical protein
MRRYDLGLVGFGQGYSGQMTPFQMALAAASIANMEGKLMRPKIEYDQPPAVFHQVVSPQQAAQMRQIMGLVPGGASGTARGVFADLERAGFTPAAKQARRKSKSPSMTRARANRKPRANSRKTVAATSFASTIKFYSQTICALIRGISALLRSNDLKSRWRSSSKAAATARRSPRQSQKNSS